MQTIISQFVARPIPFAIAAVVAVFLLIGVGKFVKGAARVILILILLAAIAGVLLWMAKGGPLPV